MDAVLVKNGRLGLGLFTSLGLLTYFHTYWGISAGIPYMISDEFCRCGWCEVAVNYIVLCMCECGCGVPGILGGGGDGGVDVDDVDSCRRIGLDWIGLNDEMECKDGQRAESVPMISCHHGVVVCIAGT
ncbi:hypothetical protein BO71DRAFT_243513 [Aspergillus ellipticus CBS 707.79]|uniref:Uncharacterized protein n=1 Tax=Aspergillus ellipticus CBS 707.79 TaxID=1448320 RepID=A0A319D9V6_9EURO|nr:hypothetical protein BO71DRAFT_243513 [Aspergillus ellipticus CBS 707.79]